MTSFLTNLSILSPNMGLDFVYFEYFENYGVKYLMLKGKKSLKCKFYALWHHFKNHAKKVLFTIYFW